jgi:hypothetical protein
MKESLNSKAEKENVKFLYLKDFDIYVIDYSGTITLDKGLSNMDLIEKEIRELSFNKNCIKIILDVRNTIWENRETHDVLSKVARNIFNPNNFDCMMYSAILNDEIEGPAIENEQWFVQEEDAIKWLVKMK